MTQLYVTLLGVLHGLGDRFRRDEEGATAVEYGLMVALIAVVIFAAVQLIGTNLRDVFDAVATCVGGGVCTAP